MRDLPASPHPSAGEPPRERFCACGDQLDPVHDGPGVRCIRCVEINYAPAPGGVVEDRAHGVTVIAPAVLAPRPAAGFPDAAIALNYLGSVHEGVASAEHAAEALALVYSELRFLRSLAERKHGLPVIEAAKKLRAYERSPDLISYDGARRAEAERLRVYGISLVCAALAAMEAP